MINPSEITEKYLGRNKKACTFALRKKAVAIGSDRNVGVDAKRSLKVGKQ